MRSVRGTESAELRAANRRIRSLILPNEVSTGGGPRSITPSPAGIRSILNNAKVMAFPGFRAGPPSYDWRDVAAQKRIALARASGMGWEAAQLLAQIDTADDFYFDTCTQVKLQRWTAGRVALLGDAACCASPLSGHGTTIAIVGAYVLASELAAAAGNHAVAFARYEHQLRP